ncbi:Cysteine-rich receptor-like protein kinase 25 [Linum perenne]
MNYTSLSPYHRSLNLTLSSLAANASRAGYFTTSTSYGSEVSYGLVQCRGYISEKDCKTCANTLSTTVTQLCPNQKEASICDEQCTLQYADWDFFSTADVLPRILLWSPLNLSYPDSFDVHLQGFLKNLSLKAATDPSKLAAGRSRYKDFLYVYSMVQCTIDISVSDCLNCLQVVSDHIPRTMPDAAGVRLFSFSCNLRYETYPFFRLQTSPPASSTLPPLMQPNSTSIGTNSTNGYGKKFDTRTVTLVVIPVVASVAVLALVCAIVYYFLRVRAPSIILDGSTIDGDGRTESLLISLSVLKEATGDFSSESKLGEGGFGPLYKGKLPGGQEIAVKRLSTSSRQGLEELKTEVMSVAKLLHRNLARLLGFCLEEEEKILVYEYLPNGSLDKILYDPKRRFDLDWGTRYTIIIGIARGLLYLHEDSQLRIIHRDLKASNILLDESMSPKISDFGLARLFHGSEIEGNTNQIAGTYDYMAPEYARHGHFSVKSDVYSFGILLLELVTGRRNNIRNTMNIQSHVWDHWSKGVALQVRDPAMENRCANTEVLKCIHIGLLCVQESFSDRPTMSEVVMMLTSHTHVQASTINCLIDRNYTYGSPYQLNLRLALKSLADNASLSDYITTAIGQRPNVVYGQVQCRGYTRRDACQACARNMVTGIIQNCPNQKQGSIDSEKCSLQYSDLNFFSIMDSEPRLYQYNADDATHLVPLGRNLGELLDSLSPSAAASASRIYSGMAAYTKDLNIYAMVQCSKGISGSDCLTCLNRIATRYILFMNKMGQGESGLLVAQGCNLRVDTFQFFAAAPSSQPGSNQSPPPSSVPSDSVLEETDHWTNHVGDSKRSLESLLIELVKLREATKNFSDGNKLGQGGFGPVYKGKMPDGQEIAVKRLSTSSKQGLEELQTEVMFVAKLMHQNLVRLIGFCIEEEEKLLVYEYLPNGSLDKFLFDQKRRLKLTWEMRYNIIVGIARGLLYLHEEHPLKIIHRDMKASNILLDESMTPKISDFGLARLFPGTRSHCFTNRIIGTYGYMAPEYAVRGRYSTKSDVYSFGILVLEIITGRKNSSFQEARNLQSYAWKHWINGTALKIMDPTLGEEFNKDEVLKCINIGLLSVQEAAEKRPTMSDVILKLGSYAKLCPLPLLTKISDTKNITAPDSSNEDSELTEKRSRRGIPPTIMKQRLEPKAAHLLFISCLFQVINAQFFTCNNDTNYTSLSPYRHSLNQTLSSLAANASKTGYFTTATTTPGINGSSFEVSYGLVQCRGYTSPEDCKTCAKNFSTQITELCPTQKEASMFDDRCTMQYADWNFFSTADALPRISMMSSLNMSYTDSFNVQLKGFLENLSSEAAADPSRLAVGSSRYKGFPFVYGMVQCTLEISESGCLNCLQEISDYVPKIIGDASGGRLFSLSCNFRYETYPFFRLQTPPPDSFASPPLMQPNSTSTNGNSKKSKTRTVALVMIPVLASVAVLALVCAIVYYFLRVRVRAPNVIPDGSTTDGDGRTESLLISLNVLKAATGGFSSDNKLGEGGFGPVYKGKLPGGQEIAVKRLSTSSRQGLEELKTEVMLVAKLLHRNLVRLLGFCLEEEEKILVYEYLPNGSLDKTLYDLKRRFDLDWATRYKIIIGIARGLLYLHEDSQLRIIHRDLKASNILLDESMSPKISDFGLARLFHGSETQGNTNQVAGTYGYMAPEYARHGHFSVKSDVYSFGILLLELVTGRRNKIRNSMNLQSHVCISLELISNDIMTGPDRENQESGGRFLVFLVQSEPISLPF